MKASSSTLNIKNQKLFQFTQGLSVDKELFAQEIRVQKAWAGALFQGGYLTKKECDDLLFHLDQAYKKMSDGSFPWSEADEDIHMNLERYLTEKTGEPGKKIHLGRSRNDLIATTLRLFVNETLADCKQLVRTLIQSVISRSEAWSDILVPGLTHTQSGKVSSFGHMFLSHGWALERDSQRLTFTRNNCLKSLPLGAGPFSGTWLKNLDLKSLATELGFEQPLQHAYDAVGDRDFMVEALQNWSLLASHLSRLCEEIIFWSSGPVNVLSLPTEWSTGSSVMPNKRNPDICEIVRAKCSGIIGGSQQACSIIRSVLPSYGSDLHELKKEFFRLKDELYQCLDILPNLILGLEINQTKAARLLESGHILATDIADLLCQKGMTFREAWQQTAAWTKEADAKSCQIHELESVRQITDVSPDFQYFRNKCNLSGGCGQLALSESIETLISRLNLESL